MQGRLATDEEIDELCKELKRETDERDSHVEQFAEQHAEQWLGCVACGSSHHKTSFCPKCGKCYFTAREFDNTPHGDFVTCQCGHRDLWD